MINITIAGDLGSGKSTVANHLINNINYRIESAGLIFRRLAEQHGMTAKEFNQFIESNPKYDNMVDDAIKEMGEKEENIIFDSRLAWYFVPKSFKIYMYVDIDTATERIFNDKGRVSESYSDMETAKKEIIERRQSEVLRYKTFYNVDIDNYNNYDFIIDTSHATKEEVNELVLSSFLAFSSSNICHAIASPSLSGSDASTIVSHSFTALTMSVSLFLPPDDSSHVIAKSLSGSTEPSLLGKSRICP